jgi:hypothetical protein
MNRHQCRMGWTFPTPGVREDRAKKGRKGPANSRYELIFKICFASCCWVYRWETVPGYPAKTPFIPVPRTEKTH